MSVSDRVNESLVKFISNDLENALIQICIAIDATAKKEYPKSKKVGERFKLFVKSNQDIITYSIFGDTIIDWVYGDFTIEEFIYKVLRCGLLQEENCPINYNLQNMANCLALAAKNGDSQGHLLLEQCCLLYVLSQTPSKGW